MPKAIAYAESKGGLWRSLPSSVWIPSINFDWAEHPTNYFTLLFDDGTVRDRSVGTFQQHEDDFQRILEYLKGEK